MRHPIGRAVALLLALSALSVPAASAAAAPQARDGKNDWSCQVSKRHPYPLIIVGGTAGNVSGETIAQAGNGRCTYELDYGRHWATAWQLGAVGPMRRSAHQLAALVDKVLAATGTTKVDLYGTSQGGLLAAYYTKVLGQAHKVHRVAMVVPTTHGTQMDGLITTFVTTPGLRQVADIALTIGCPACRDQLVGSRFVRELERGPIAQPGVEYAVLATRFDKNATPPGVSSFINEPGVSNHFIQDFCPDDTSDHHSVPSAEWLRNALAGHPDKSLTCGTDTGPR